MWFGIVNCSNPSSVELCTRLRVSEDHGFPAVFAWRALHTSREADSLCESMPSADSGPEHDWLRINYHHALSVSVGTCLTENVTGTLTMGWVADGLLTCAASCLVMPTTILHAHVFLDEFVWCLRLGTQALF